ncbi:MAG: M28 family peptidase [Bacteroidia bacterium]|nr:M28 family peptidase [Bacteroidia bacterium]
MEYSLKQFQFIVPFILLLCIKCSDPQPSSTKENVADKKVIKVKNEIIPPTFQTDSAYNHLQWMENNGPRVPGSKPHERFVNWAEQKLKNYGGQVIVQMGNTQTYDGKNFSIKNIIASFFPERNDRILLCSHYDSRPFCEKETDPKLKSKPCPGINDGGSGVAILLELARIFKEKDPGIGIDVIFFDMEDYGNNNGNPETWCLGSQYWAKNLHKPNYSARFGILLDMVGHQNATFPKEGYSMYYAPDITDKIWHIAQSKGFGKYFIQDEGPELTDDHYFINTIAKIPCVDIIDYKVYKHSFFEHHHTTQDILKKIDKNTLFAVGTTLLYVIYNHEQI